MGDPRFDELDEQEPVATAMGADIGRFRAWQIGRRCGRGRKLVQLHASLGHLQLALPVA